MAKNLKHACIALISASCLASCGSTDEIANDEIANDEIANSPMGEDEIGFDDFLCDDVSIGELSSHLYLSLAQDCLTPRYTSERFEKARLILEELDKRGDLEATHLLASMYIAGRFGTPDNNDTRNDDWARPVTPRLEPGSGYSVEYQDRRMATALLQKGANAGHVPSLVDLADAYLGSARGPALDQTHVNGRIFGYRLIRPSFQSASSYSSAINIVGAPDSAVTGHGARINSVPFSIPRAVELLSSAASKSGDDEEGLRAVGYANAFLGQHYMYLREYDTAIPYLIKALQNGSTTPNGFVAKSPLGLLSRAYYEIGEYEKSYLLLVIADKFNDHYDANNPIHTIQSKPYLGIRGQYSWTYFDKDRDLPIIEGPDGEIYSVPEEEFYVFYRDILKSKFSLDVRGEIERTAESGCLLYDDDGTLRLNAALCPISVS